MSGLNDFTRSKGFIADTTDEHRHRSVVGHDHVRKMSIEARRRIAAEA